MKSIESLLKELYVNKTLNYEQYYNLLTALDIRVKQAVNTGILMAANKLQVPLKELIADAKVAVKEDLPY